MNANVIISVHLRSCEEEETELYIGAEAGWLCYTEVCRLVGKVI